MVTLKVAIIVIVVIAGLKYVDAANFKPFVPPNTGTFGHFGVSGVLQGAGIIFFSYVGFDTASTMALEARNPQRDLPIGILGALAISTVLYVAMATVLIGMVPFHKLNVARAGRGGPGYPPAARRGSPGRSRSASSPA